MGSRLGPAALRLAELVPTLQALVGDVRDLGDLAASVESSRTDGLRNFDPLLACLKELRTRTQAVLEAGRIPLILGGEHDLAIGSVGSALAVHDGDLALLWIDAHADANTPATSTTGNLHGMPIAALQGLSSGVSGICDDQWRSLCDQIVPSNRLRPELTSWFGLRDVDPGERDLIRRTPGDLAISMHDIDRQGVVAAVEKLDTWMRGSGAKKLWISFDVDVLDPILAPGTGTAVRGGLSYREGHLMAELLRERLDAADCPYSLAGVDLVEVNPLFDTNNETAKMAVEWIGSLFGKTIMGVK